MKFIIFYSWQSTTEGKYNRYFIKDCIESATKQIRKNPDFKNIVFEVQDGVRGEAGSPPVADKIMERISQCDIFIADLSVTNWTEKWKLWILKNILRIKIRPEQNKNVIDEHGIARATIGDRGIIGILNAKYGSPNENPENITFDLRHLRFPIEYNFSKRNENSKSEIKNQLVSKLTSALKSTIPIALQSQKSKFKPFLTWSEHSERSSNKSVFFENNTIIGIKKSLIENKSSLRFLGLSGLGKTRITFEAFRNESVLPNYLYCDCQSSTETSILGALDKIFLNKANTQTVVVDNCPLNFFRKILRMKHELGAENPIISIYNEPEEISIDRISSVDYIQLFISGLKSVIEKMLENLFSDLTEDQKKIIIEFSEGIPFMAVLLAENIRNEKQNLGLLSDKELLDKLLSTASQKDMEILKACSIFRYIGFEAEAREQIEFVVTNKDITPISGEKEEKMAIFDRLFLKYHNREIFEKNGRLFGVRPRPLAFYLATQWFETCSPERLGRVFDSLQDSGNKNGRILIEALSKQITYLENNPKVAHLIEKITATYGPFDDAKVVNTELGSRLFRSFVDVNPIAIADNLFRLFGSMPIEDLKKIKEGRRNIVWALEKLCFNKATFEKGAKLMMSFGVAENERWSNNASGEFLRLFKILLPATEANLDERLNIIKWGLEKDGDFKQVAIKALDSALETRNFSYFSGAEKQGLKTLQHYHPTTQEIREYWTSVLNLLKSEIIHGTTDTSEQCCSILAKNVRGLVRSGFADLILSCIGEIIVFKENDWDEMLDSLHFVLNYDLEFGNENTEDTVLNYIETLAKKDFVSKFREVNKQRRWEKSQISFEDSIKQQHEAYKELAIEFVNKNWCSKEILKSLYSDKDLFTGSFGYRIAEITRENQESTKLFIDTSIEVLSEISEKSYPPIFINYAQGLKETTVPYLTDSLLRQPSLSYLLFPILAVRDTEIDNLSVLFSLLDKDSSMVSYFRTFFQYSRFRVIDEDIKVARLLESLKKYDEQGVETIISIASDLLCLNDKASSYDNILNLAEEIILTKSFRDIKELTTDKWLQVIGILLNKSDRPKLAIYANNEIINLAANDFDLWDVFSRRYEFEKLYSALLTKYFDIIWQDLSNALLSDGVQYLTFFNLKRLLDSTIGGVSNAIGPLFQEGNDGVLLAWCSANPQVAPARLASMVPIYQGEDFHPLVISLIDQFGDNREMLDSLSANMGSFSWIGSVIPLYKRKKKVLEKLLSHKNQIVIDWAKEQIEYANKEIANAQQREEEERFLYS